MRTFIVAAFVLLMAAPAYAEPCGGIAISRGRVSTGQPLPVTRDISGPIADCAKAIAGKLAGMPALRTATVAVSLPDAERLGGVGLEFANAWVAALAAGGLSASKISGVAPAAATGQSASIVIQYTEKKATHPVALAESVGGTVVAGGSMSSLNSIAGGSMLPAKSAVETKVGGRVTFGLADGSRLRLAERSVLVFGTLHLNDEMKRVVSLDLLKGSIEAHVAPGGPGSTFQVNTKTGVAGAKGTAFRVVADEEGATRVETLHGLVALTGQGEGEAVELGAGMRSHLKDDGTAAAPTEMLGEPELKAPLQGEFERGKKLRWKAMKGVDVYRVQLARDAEFTLDTQVLESKRGHAPVPKELASGKWFWRVIPYERDGSAGLSSRIYAFTIPE